MEGNKEGRMEGRTECWQEENRKKWGKEGEMDEERNGVRGKGEKESRRENCFYMGLST